MGSADRSIGWRAALAGLCCWLAVMALLLARAGGPAALGALEPTVEASPSASEAATSPDGAMSETGSGSAESPSSTPPPAAAGDASGSGEPTAPAEPLIGAGIALQTVGALAGGAPANVQLVTSVVLSRLAFLPDPVIDALFTAYRQGVDALTAGATVFGQFASDMEEATAMLSPMLNPALRTALGPVLATVQAALSAGGDAAVLTGTTMSFPDWLVSVVALYGDTLGIVEPAP